MDRRLVTISKFLAKHLRHAPDALGLILQPGGWASVDELLAASERIGFSITYDELMECVETNDKKRFSFDDMGDLIRANQGHSIEVDLQLEEKQAPDVLYHGTVERFLASIMTEGLKKSKRHHVHLSKDIETARKVGSRRGKPIVLQIDAGKMHDAGFQFFLSVNGVWPSTLPVSTLKSIINPTGKIDTFLNSVRCGTSFTTDVKGIRSSFVVGVTGQAPGSTCGGGRKLAR